MGRLMHLQPSIGRRFFRTESLPDSPCENLSPAARKGLRPGDVIAMVGRQPVASPDDVVREVAKARDAERSSVLLKIVRGSQSRYVALGLA